MSERDVTRFSVFLLPGRWQCGRVLAFVGPHGLAHLATYQTQEQLGLPIFFLESKKTEFKRPVLANLCLIFVRVLSSSAS